MTASAQLQKAIDTLRIQDVYLRDGFAQCADDFNPKYAPNLASLEVQQMHAVRQSIVADVEDDGRIFQVFIRLGVRWINPDDETDEPHVFAIIEGEFIAEYQMQEELDQECIDAFAEKNASFHVWPYWREFLSSQCERLRLPRLILPAVQFAQNNTDSNQE